MFKIANRFHSANTFRSGIASEYLSHLQQLIEQTERFPLLVWLYCRKSNRGTDNLDNQVADALNNLISPQIHIIGTTSCVESSFIHADRPGLKEAIWNAKEHGAILVAPDRSRFLRRLKFLRNGKLKDEPPTNADYLDLLHLTKGVTLATILHPDTSPGETRSYQTKRRKSRLAEFKKRTMPKIIRLAKRGLSLRKIVESITTSGHTVSQETIRKWLKNLST